MPYDHRATSLAFCLSLLACQRSEPKSNLEKMAEAEREVAETMNSQAPREPLQFAALPNGALPPAGVDPSLWADVGWFPASIVGISPLREQLMFVEWLRGNLEAVGVACTSVLDGIDRYYMVEHADATQQTLVFYGSLDRAAIEDCARTAFAKLPPTAPRVPVRTDGVVTRIGEGEQAHHIGWLKRGEDVIAVYDTSRAHVDAMLGAGDKLAANTELVELLRNPPVGAITSMGLRDFGSAFLQVPSVGYSFAVAMDNAIELHASLYFADATSASRASAEADGLITDLEAAGLGVGQLVNEGVEGSRLRLRMALTLELLADPETKLRSIMEVISKRRTEAGLEPIDVDELVRLAQQASG